MTPHSKKETVLYSLPKKSVDALVAFRRLVSEINTPSDVLSLLVESSVESIDGEGAAIFQIARDTAELELAASKNIPASFQGFKTEAGFVGTDFTADLLKLCGAEFTHAHPFPLISNTDLFGVLIVFFREKKVLNEGQIALLEAQVHLAAIALGKTDQVSKLRKALSELQASQEALIRTENLRALGQMSASISHDLRNILAPMVMRVELLKRMTEVSAPSMKLIEGFEQSLKRGVDTAERFRDFSRQSPEDGGGEDAALNDLVREACEISRPRIHSGVSLKLELVEDLPLVHIRTSDFVSVIVNLLFNAIDALKGQGEITISSGVSSGGAWVRVADNGPGMSAEVRNKVFEPFFTTKGKEGTGLGLSMVYSFVERHYGRITLDTVPGEGAAFTLWFPAATDRSNVSNG